MDYMSHRGGGGGVGLGRGCGGNECQRQSDGMPCRSPTVLHLCGPPTGIFVSHVLRQKGTYGLIGH